MTHAEAEMQRAKIAEERLKLDEREQIINALDEGTNDFSDVVQRLRRTGVL